MVLEFMRQPQRIPGNRPFDRVRGWPSAWRHGERERVSHDDARDLTSSANGTPGDAAYVYQSLKSVNTQSVIANGNGGSAL